ncbi:MAG: zinc ABC transporter substrate-binding protein [Muribaculaceae bacterium]|nr:zinc ABC transporter substrate-binding protein [Muribaculaceae bacterium]
MRRLAAAMLSALALSACTKDESATPAYMVSIEPQRHILEALVDSGTTVVTMLERGADPETFEPSMSRRAEADRVEAYFGTGVLPFEQKLKESTDSRFFDMSEGLSPIYGTHSHAGHSHSDEIPDPHYWTSVGGLRLTARNMAAALIAMKPETEAAVTKRLATLEAHLDSIDCAISDRLRATGQRTFAVWHPSLSYFARDYGLRQITLGQEGKEMSPLRIRQAIDEAKADSVRVFFIQREYDTRQAEAINEGIGSRLVVVDPLAYRWEDELNKIADELSRP